VDFIQTSTKYKNPSTKYKNRSSTKYKNPSTKCKNPSSTKYKNPSFTKGFYILLMKDFYIL
jgi:hypothetical protein